MNKVMQVVGGVGYHRRFPIERIYRDVLAGPILPFNNHDSHMIFAEEALDLPPGVLGVYDEPAAEESEGDLPGANWAGPDKPAAGDQTPDP